MAWEAGKNFLMGQGIYYVMGGVGLIGLVCTAVLYVVGRMLYKRALKPDRDRGYIDGMSRELGEQIAARGYVNNVNNFVSNYFSIHKFGIIPLVSLDWFCGQLVYLCLLIGIISGGLGYIWKIDMEQCLNIAVFGAVVFGSLLCIRKMVNYGAKMEKVRQNLTAYFENTVIPEHIKKAKEKSRAAADREIEEKRRADKRAKRAERLLGEAQNEKRRLESGQDKQGDISIVKDKSVKPEDSIAAAEDAAEKTETRIEVVSASDKSAQKEKTETVYPEVGTQAKLLVQMNSAREFAQKTMDNGRDRTRGEAEAEVEKEVAAALIRPLERESTRKTSQTLTEKEEKIIADILKEYSK